MNMSAAFFPCLTELQGNPYWRLLAAGLEAEGVRVLPENPRVLWLRWLWTERRRVQVLHFHYFQDNYAYQGTQARLRWVLRLARNLVLARLLGYRIVWTVHNETPSFPLQPQWVEELAHHVMARLAHALIVHCEYARDMVAQRYGRRKGVYVISHPNFIGIYPGQATREEARGRLGLPGDAFVFLCFGQLRPNKGIENVLRVFPTLPGETLRLMIAGAPGPDEGYIETLKTLTAADQRISLRAECVPDEDVHTLYMAADVVVAPFTRVLTSSSVMLALSLGTPVIAPAVGCMEETVGAAAGWLYDPETQAGLREAMQTALASNLPKARAQVKATVELQTWTSCAHQTRRTYGRPFGT